MNIFKYIFALIFLMSMGVKAQTVEVSFDPSLTGPVAIGDTFFVDIVANYVEPNVLVGGSVSFDFDASIVNIVGITVNTAIADISSSSGTIDNTTNTGGKVDTIGFATFLDNAVNIFDIATIEFEAIEAGTTQLILSDPGDLVFAWANSDIEAVTPNFTNGSITVIPLPAAIWFLASGLGLLVVRSRTI